MSYRGAREVRSPNDPTANDDSDHGYKVGYRWNNPDNQTTWICISAVPGAAIWVNQAGGCATPTIGTQPTGGVYDFITPVDLVMASEDAESFAWIERIYTDDIAAAGSYDEEEVDLVFSADTDYDNGDVLRTASGELLLIVNKIRFQPEAEVLRGYGGTTPQPIADESVIQIYRPIAGAIDPEYAAEPGVKTDYIGLALNECGATATNKVTVETPVFVDFSGVEDTEDYVPDEWDALLTGAGGDVVSGLLTPTVEGESSYKFKSSVLELNGKTIIDVTIPSADVNSTGASTYCIYFCDSHTPGNLSLINSPAGLTGYMVILGQTQAFLNRVIAGTDSDLGTYPSVADPAGLSIRVRLTVNENDVTFQVYRNEVLVTNGTVVDSNAARVTNFRTVGLSIRKAGSTVCLLSGLEVLGQAA